MTNDTLRILVVEDDTAMREVLETRLAGWGYQVRSADCATAARALLDAFDPHVVISDLVLPDLSGLELLHALREDGASRQVLLITAYGTIDTAVEAMKLGARDFLTKPLDYVGLKQRLEEADQERAARPARPPRAGRTVRADSAPQLGELVGTSAAQRQLYDLIRAVSVNDATVLIVGETGTGKELVARTIHESSTRATQPFVAVNSAAIPEGMTEGELFGHERGAFTGAMDSRPGLFEQADRGTLFLDEITEMPVGLQAKFLRVLEDRRVRRLGSQREVACDVRIIAATNRDPVEAVARGLLRSDLYYRLNVFQIDVPALRERVADIPALVQHFVERFAARHDTPVAGLEAGALERLTSHHWPGNVRELRNVVERAVILAAGGPIRAEHLPFPGTAPVRDTPRGIVLPRGVTSADAERILILETLRQTGNNKAEAARRLGVDVKTIRNKLKAFAARAE